METWRAFALAAIIVGLLANCALLAVPTQEDTGYTKVTVDQFAMMLEDKDFVLVNVHVPYEGEMPQTDLFIPFNEMDRHADELPGKDDPIVLYCRSGPMSTAAAEALVALSYTNVKEVDGGMRAWSAAGYELLQR